LQNGEPLSSSEENSASSCSGDDARTFLWSVSKLGAIITYFYVCDRTNFFMKENK
jgi:hypothetical protein